MSKVPDIKTAQKVSQIDSIGSKSVMQVAPTVSKAFIDMAEQAQEIKAKTKKS